MDRVIFNWPDWKFKALTMSYDDGMIFDRRLVQIFNENGLKGSFHLNSGLFGADDRHIDASEVAELYAGHEVSCHSVSHPSLYGLPGGEVLRQVWFDRRNLEALCGYPVVGMSYPNGAVNAEVAAILRSCQVIYSRTVESTGKFTLPGDFLLWHPTCHHRDMLKLAPAFLNKSYGHLMLFYVWGHSYEFDDSGNWAEMEEFASLTGGRSDLWYATNIEICRYVQAVRSIVTTADGTIYYNPTAIRVCFTVNEKKFELNPGETLKI